MRNTLIALASLLLTCQASAAVIHTVQGGDTDVTVVIQIRNATTGAAATTIDWNTAGIDLEYWRPGSAVTNITEATLASVSAAHADGGIEHLGGGEYRLDLPDAAVAAGVPFVYIQGTITDYDVYGGVVEIVAYDPLDAADLGLTDLTGLAAAVANVDSDVGTLSTTVGTVSTNVSSTLTGVNLFNSVTIMASVQAADSGTVSTIVDAARNEADADYWRGVAAVPLTGTNAMQARCVVDFDQLSDTLTVVPPWTQAITTNSYILVRDTNCVGVDPAYTP